MPAYRDRYDDSDCIQKKIIRPAHFLFWRQNDSIKKDESLLSLRDGNICNL